MKSKNPSPVTEAELRQALRDHLASAHDGSAYLMEELPIENGAARIDMALVSETINGYEIKSDLDNAARLFNQIHTYNRVFEHIYIVTGPESAKMLDGVLPPWWGVLHGERQTDGSIQLIEHRCPADNASRDPFSLLMLLKRDELNDLAENQQLPKKVIKGTKFALLDMLASSLPLPEISDFVITQLKARGSLSAA